MVESTRRHARGAATHFFTLILCLCVGQITLSFQLLNCPLMFKRDALLSLKLRLHIRSHHTSYVDFIWAESSASHVDQPSAVAGYIVDISLSLE